ncbi:MAG TPA: methionyl-tRNA formyltransferase [Candidatus Nanoperiomorbaceae bacterium]|jgi:methionyl-tRNA formyltransferase|nr:methionyl-tRNA formyltransferase [Candidatus Nanoperiomorbaceae bacterium]HMQ96810.1 methionyl-tRNA formyltransferase [Candidatus Nanoperiomorbaceae bacterium]HMR86138.1 methionyl-tRNA formyltransferase [Candidatus Nanoperiomorbaceae bacterium]
MTNIVFFGTEEFSVPTLEALIASDYEIAAVVTKPDSVRGRGHKIDSPTVAKIATSHNIKVLQPGKLSDIRDDLIETHAPIGVLVSYGKIIPQSIIDIFPNGIINLHPSLLPQYRGPSPMETAIVNGDSKTGLTIMSLVREMDAGPIYYQEVVPLSGTETKPELYDVLSRRGAELLVDKLPSILDGQLPAEPQDESLATYCRLIDRQTDGVIDPHTMTASECERRVRAYLGWPKTRLSYLGSEVIVTKARILDNYQGDAWPDVIKCHNDTYLQIIELVAPSGKQMKTADYLRGIRS